MQTPNEVNINLNFNFDIDEILIEEMDMKELAEKCKQIAKVEMHSNFTKNIDGAAPSKKYKNKTSCKHLISNSFNSLKPNNYNTKEYSSRNQEDFLAAFV